MKIVILLPVRVGASGGFLKHLTEVVPRWLRSTDVDSVTIITPKGILNELEKLGVEVKHVSQNDYLTGFAEMGKLVEVGGFDVAFSTTSRPVKLYGCPIVTMVRNIEPIQKATYKMPIIWRLRLWALRREFASACRQADRILAVSQYTRDEVFRRFNIQSNKIDVVYHGFDTGELAVARKPDLNLPTEDFIFSAGSMVPHRGFEDIICAVATLRSCGREVPCVVLAGNKRGHLTPYEQALGRLARSLNVEDGIVWAGQLQRDEMTWCYQNAKLYIQTSRAESFSNIQVEAMGHGCMCVSCDHPPMPEIFEDAPFYYPTGDAGALAARIQSTLELGQEEVEMCQARVRKRASFFSWDKTAVQTLEVLKRTVSGWKLSK
jgi:glycosyltransferase involved in cell wall biosynthesis